MQALHSRGRDSEFRSFYDAKTSDSARLPVSSIGGILQSVTCCRIYNTVKGKRREPVHAPASAQSTQIVRSAGGQFAPGHAANPSGKPKVAGLLVHLRRIMNEVIPGELGPDGSPITYGESLAMATVNMARNGHPQALKEVYERIEGKVKDTGESGTGDLWARLSEGRMRLSQRETVTEVTTSIDGARVERAIVREVSFDAPADESQPMNIVGDIQSGEPAE